MPAPFTIGRVARAAGVHVETIRYYQRRGLIDEPPRPTSGYRVYPPDTVARIRFIKRAQELGFRLREIRELLALGEGSCADIQARAIAKRAVIERQIADLKRLHQTLDRLIRACEQQRDPHHCPIVESLSSESGAKPDTPP